MPRNKKKHNSLRSISKPQDHEKKILKKKLKKMLNNKGNIEDYDNDFQIDNYSWNSNPSKEDIEKYEEPSISHNSKLENKNDDDNVIIKTNVSNRKKRKLSNNLLDVEHRSVEGDNRNMLKTMFDIVNCDETQFTRPSNEIIIDKQNKNKIEVGLKAKKNKKKKCILLRDEIADECSFDPKCLNELHNDDIIIGDGASDSFSIESLNNDSFVFDADNQLAYMIKAQIKKRKMSNGNSDDSLIEFGNISFNLSPSRSEEKIEYISSAVEVLLSNKKPHCVVKSPITPSYDGVQNNDNEESLIVNDVTEQLEEEPNVLENPIDEHNVEENEWTIIDNDVTEQLEEEPNVLEKPIDENNVEENEWTIIDTSGNDFKIYVFSDFCIGAFRQNSKVYFCGQTKVSVLHGNVEIFGHVLTEAFQNIYSLDCSCLLCFETYPCETKFNDVENKLKQLGVSLDNIRNIFNSTTEGDAIILLKPLNSPMIDFIKHYLPKLNLISKPKGNVCNRLYDVLKCTLQQTNTEIFTKNPTWDSIVDSILANNTIGSVNNITILGGGKRSGKSTMLRYLVNKVLAVSPVLVIDLDPGQSEFTICGSISATIVKEPLIGPNFTHLLKPVKSFCLGLLNIADNEDRYINGIKSLFAFCDDINNISKMPWIINTMGYSTSEGYQLFSIIYNIFKPNRIVETMSSTRRTKHNFETPLTPQNLCEKPGLDCQYYAVDSFSPDNRNTCLNNRPNPKTERLLNLLAYFSQINGVKHNSILGIKPFVVSLDKINVLFNNILVSIKYTMNILNGCIVALCGKVDQNQGLETIFKYGSDPISCFGHGLIRGVDPVHRELYILTPENLGVLMNVNTLIYGESLPDCGSLLSIPNLVKGTTVPYTAPLQEGLKHSHLLQIPKRKFNALRLLEMARLN